MIKSQIYLMKHRKEYQFCKNILWLFSCLSFVLVVLEYRNYDVSSLPDANQLFVLWDWVPMAAVITALFPILLELPFATSYYDETQNDALALILSRRSRANVYCTKVLVCFMVTFGTFCIPLLWNLFLTNIFFPHSNNFFWGEYQMPNYYRTLLGTNVFVDTRFPEVPFYRLFISTPALYNVVYAILFSGVAGVLACFMMSISFVFTIKKKWLFIPLFVFTIGMRAVEGANSRFSISAKNYINWNPMVYITPSMKFGRNYGLFSIFLIGIILLTGLNTIIAVNRKR